VFLSESNHARGTQEEIGDATSTPLTGCAPGSAWRVLPSGSSRDKTTGATQAGATGENMVPSLDARRLIPAGASASGPPQGGLPGKDARMM